MKRPSDNLFQLIKSLSKTEKRYFKRFASIHIKGNSNNYIRLFDAIDKQKEYNEAKILKLFKEEKFIKHLSSEKVYLFNQILRSLRNFYSESLIDVSLKGMFQDVNILYSKRLFEPCIRILSKIKKLAYESERFLIVLEAMALELGIIQDQNNMEECNKYIEHEFNTEKELLKKYSNLRDYVLLNSKFFFLSRVKGSAYGKSASAYLKMMNTPLLKNESLALSFQSKIFFNHINGGCAIIKNNFNEAYLYYKKVLEHTERYPQVSKRQLNYIFTLYNFLLSCLLSNKHEEFLLNLRKLKAIIPDTKGNEAIIFYCIHNLEVTFYFYTGWYVEPNLPKLIEKGLKKYHNKITKANQLQLIYSNACIYLTNSEYTESLKYLNMLLNDNFLSLREDIQVAARILNLIVHWELKHEELLPYLTRSTYHFLRKKELLYEYETILLNFIKQKLFRVFTRAEFKNSLKTLQRHLNRIAGNPLKNILYFDILSYWIESKVSNKSMVEVLKSRIN